MDYVSVSTLYCLSTCLCIGCVCVYSGPLIQVSAHWYYLHRVMTVQLECLLNVCVLLEYLNGVLYIDVWTPISHFSAHTQGLMSLDKLGSTVYLY